MQQVEIHLKGELDCHWAEWFEGLQLTHTAAGETQLRGTVPDQAALFGLMAKLRNLGLTVASLTIAEVETTDEIAMIADKEEDPCPPS